MEVSREIAVGLREVLEGTMIARGVPGGLRRFQGGGGLSVTSGGFRGFRYASGTFQRVLGDSRCLENPLKQHIRDLIMNTRFLSFSSNVPKISWYPLKPP